MSWSLLNFFHLHSNASLLGGYLRCLIFERIIWRELRLFWLFGIISKYFGSILHLLRSKSEWWFLHNHIPLPDWSPPLSFTGLICAASITSGNASHRTQCLGPILFSNFLRKTSWLLFFDFVVFTEVSLSWKVYSSSIGIS